MKNNKFVWGSKAACLALTAFLAAAPLEIYAAEQQTYNITFSPGKVGEFTSDFLAECETAGAAVSSRTGSVKLQVPAGSAVRLPNPADVQIKEEYEGKYVVNTDNSFLTGGSITADQSQSYVVDYAALVEGVTYRIEFIDAESGEEIAAPIIAQGNIDQVVPYVAETIEGYTLTNASSQTMTLTEGVNRMTFSYTRDIENVPPQTQIVETPGDTITRTETVPGDNVTITQYQGASTTAGGNTGAGTAAGNGTSGADNTARQTNAGTAAGNGNNAATPGTENQDGTGQSGTNADSGTDTHTENGTAVIGEEEVPLGQADLDDDENSQKDENGKSEIQDEDVPQGEITLEDDSKEKVIDPLPIAAGAAIVIVAAAGAAYYFIRRRK